MLRIPLLQQWFNLADDACEEALYDSAALRSFVRIDLGREPVPDPTTIPKFCHLLERAQLGQAIFAEVGRILQPSIECGTIDRHHHRCAEFDQERRAAAIPG